ncbi:hypothetical protein IFM89_003798 [Coptis chinensis]|uniref:Exostosin GT47 domain-containing protein n=1 Tax=Coptis chinensis TaxID=261450 RepID=A0A835LYB2_9MAGN|nr:hypothetical protein IFM89_003798 [Coptis chinensis]
MDFPLEYQKLCQIDTRKLLFLMGVIASVVLIFQFLSIPYGNVLLSLFPSGMVPSIGKTSHSAEESSQDSYMIGNISSTNISISNNSSGSSVVMKNANGYDLGTNTKHPNGGNGKKGSPNYTSEQDGDVTPENKFSPQKVINIDKNFRSGNTIKSYNGSISEKDREPELGSPSEQVPLDNDQREHSTLAKDRAASADAGIIPLAPALPPVASSTSFSFPNEMDSNSSTSVVAVNSSEFSVGEQATNMLSKDTKPEMVGSGPPTSNSSSTVTNNSIEKGSLELPQTPITSISEMNTLLLKSRASSHSTIRRWSSVRDQEILSAKSQIENAPILDKDRELYAPLFWNISMFKRSYELMEQTLKVYTYREGARPVFHQPETKGIYASEGWFMKQMEGNRQFSVKDPRKAHLFYMPFSTRRLEQFLYVPNSHSSKNLVEYLKNYLDVISSKYPFWNRTGGADHFLVACHDWAPHETVRHMSRCIRALCNADVNEGFVIGKDTSLPETNVRRATNPLRDLGGKPPSKRQILAFFAGGMHGYLRPILLQYWENKDPDMKISSHMGRGTKSRANYVQHMKNSKYCICAKGFEVNSPRVVEAIFYECVPVIISDNFVPPFFEVLNWEAFAVFIPEKDIPNLKNILLSIPEEKYKKLQMRVRRVQRHFLWNPKPVKYDIFHMILHSIWYNRVFQVSPR